MNKAQTKKAANQANSKLWCISYTGYVWCLIHLKGLFVNWFNDEMLIGKNATTCTGVSTLKHTPLSLLYSLSWSADLLLSVIVSCQPLRPLKLLSREQKCALNIRAVRNSRNSSMATAGSGQSTAPKLFRQGSSSNGDKQKLIEIKGAYSESSHVLHLVFSFPPVCECSSCMIVIVIFKKQWNTDFQWSPTSNYTKYTYNIYTA